MRPVSCYASNLTSEHQDMDNERSDSLDHYFRDIISGRLPTNERRHLLFLEAICSQEDSLSCINKLHNSPQGLESIQAALRSDPSPTFFNGRVSEFLRYLNSQSLRNVSSRELMTPILRSIVEPPAFWAAFNSAFKQGYLDADAQLGFIWLFWNILLQPSLRGLPYFQVVKIHFEEISRVLESPIFEIRVLAYKISHGLAILQRGKQPELYESGPGWRHDNDHIDFRDISIYPTGDEFISPEEPYIGPSQLPANHEVLEAEHLGVLFRCERNKMMRTLISEYEEVMRGIKPHENRITGCKVVDLFYRPRDTEKRVTEWAIVLEATSNLPQLEARKLKNPGSRRKWFVDNPWVVKHQSTVGLIVGDEVLAFGTIQRDVDILSQNSQIVIRIGYNSSTKRVLTTLLAGRYIDIFQFKATISSYLPILEGLKDKSVSRFSTELVSPGSPFKRRATETIPSDVLNLIRKNAGSSLQTVLVTDQPICLDEYLTTAVVKALSETLSVISGPPGTGKTFATALIARILEIYSRYRVQVICHNPRDLDRILKCCRMIGSDQSRMGALGSSDSIKDQQDLYMHPEPRAGFGSNGTDPEICAIEEDVMACSRALEDASRECQEKSIRSAQIMSFLRIHDSAYFDAFDAAHLSPPNSIWSQRSATYFFSLWQKGKCYPSFKHHRVKKVASIWQMDVTERLKKISHWKSALESHRMQIFCLKVQEYNQILRILDAKHEERFGQCLLSKRIIVCTAVGAAKYRNHIKMAHPELVLVAGAELIPESHFHAGLPPSVKHVVLIGDHKQSGPATDIPNLTVADGDRIDRGYSILHRILSNGQLHSPLYYQYRMRPELSALLRLLYPDLIDANCTRNRPHIRGLASSLIFIHHSYEEDDMQDNSCVASKRGKPDLQSSRSNQFEATMAVNIACCLLQQGSRADQMVILTPYREQSRKIEQAFQDKISSPQMATQSIKIATIDEYQGEETDVVIASLTRSNKGRKIGFMKASERISGLFSRARDGLIIIGNADTYSNNGKAWTQIIEAFKKEGLIFNGLPIKCEKHPDVTTSFETPESFQKQCLDCGCGRNLSDPMLLAHEPDSRVDELDAKPDKGGLPGEERAPFTQEIKSRAVPIRRPTGAVRPSRLLQQAISGITSAKGKKPIQ